MLDEPEYVKEIDRLRFCCGLSFAIFLFVHFLPRDGSSFSDFADNMGTLFGSLTIVLLVALVVRAALRWKRQNPN
jgi:hypothetical protein